MRNLTVNDKQFQYSVGRTHVKIKCLNPQATYVVERVKIEDTSQLEDCFAAELVFQGSVHPSDVKRYLMENNLC